MPCEYRARLEVRQEAMTNMTAIEKALGRMEVSGLRVQNTWGNRTLINGYYKGQIFEVVLNEGKATITSPSKAFGEKFTQMYKVEKTKMVARKNNFFVKEKVEDGRIKLIMERK